MSQIRFQVRRGRKINLPDLMEGELGFTTDTHELFIGTETATNVQVGTSGEIDTKVATAQSAAAADATSKANAAQAAAAADATAKTNAAQAAAEVTAAADATAKVAAHEAAATAHNVSQVTDAVSTTYLSINYYDKTAGDSRYMPAGMSPVVAAIIFGG
jgi:beta-glucosidase/6-phospho-beta-glucosidase/beta-galactosidase